MSTHSSGRLRNAGRRAGVSLVELMISLTVFVIGFGAVTTNLVTLRTLQRTDHETSRALEAARSMIERIRGDDFAAIYASYNEDPDDDPDGPGTAPGASFAVDGLDARPGDPDGAPGRIVMPGDGRELREDALDVTLGMPRDLNADRAVDGSDHAGDYTFLPLRVRIEWTGITGARAIELVTSITAP
jgi:type II secretory pathway pseudopilin PulG